MEQVEKFKQIIDEVYEKYADSHWIPPSNPKGKLLIDQLFSVVPMEHSKESFINKIKTDAKFSKKWGLKIEERELSLEERFNIRYPGGKFSAFQENWPNTHKRNDPNGLLDAFIIPTKLITLTYQNETIESYE